MWNRRRKTLYPYPDLPPAGTPFPTSVSRSTPLADLAGWWLEARCTCPQRRYNGRTPFRLMAAQLGWQVALGDVLDRLKCHGCGGPPKILELVDDGGGGPGRAGAPEPKRLSLLPLIRQAVIGD